MEHPDRKMCVCQGRGRYFKRFAATTAWELAEGPLSIDYEPPAEAEVYCGLHGMTDADVVQGRLMGISVAPSF